MTLVKSCGNNQTLIELLTLCIGLDNEGNYGWKVQQKTEAEMPNECGSKMTEEEKWASAVSWACDGTVATINIVLDTCDCDCGTDLPCTDSDLPATEIRKRTFAYTTDGEWALRLFVKSASRGGPQ